MDREHADWLAANGIANGFNDGTFRPNQNITRGQSAFWLGNYNDATTIHWNTNNPGSGTSWALAANCPTGKRAIAGGGWVLTAPCT